jgi:hypothetical protein
VELDKLVVIVVAVAGEELPQLGLLRMLELVMVAMAAQGLPHQ